jgi:L-lysine exporter family protein LysE/ArgO
LLTAFITGFVTLLTLILAVGAQNVFILRQGLLRGHVFAVCLFAATADAILIWTGVIGFSAISQIVPEISKFMTWAGAAFLISYGIIRFITAYKGIYDIRFGDDSSTLSKSLLALAGFTFLNPHVYLDTLGLIGAVSVQYDDALSKYAFATGASVGSLIFFFILGYGARILSPLMSSTGAWQILDIVIGITMLAIAASLLSN